MSAGTFFYCPHCDKMVLRTEANEHLAKDAESYGDNGPSFAESLMLAGRLMKHNSKGSP